MRILLTGGTGFLGESLIPLLQADSRVSKIYLLVRPQSANRAQFLYRNMSKVAIIRGDITLPQIFMHEGDRKILSEITALAHLAAYYDLRGSYSDCFINNVVGTQNILFLVRYCPMLTSIHYASSISIVGEHQGIFEEQDLNQGQRFADAYAKSKFEAELLINNLAKEGSELAHLKTRVYRLGILVGDRQSGIFKEKNGPYYFLEFLSKIRGFSPALQYAPYIPLPFERTSVFPLAPVDWVAEVLAQGILNVMGEERLKTYHVIPRNNATVGEFLQDALATFGISRPIFALPKNKLNNFALRKLGLPAEFLTYVYSKAKLQRLNFSQDYPQTNTLDYHDFKTSFLQGALKKWGHA